MKADDGSQTQDGASNDVRTAGIQVQPGISCEFSSLPACWERVGPRCGAFLTGSGDVDCGASW